MESHNQYQSLHRTAGNQQVINGAWQFYLLLTATLTLAWSDQGVVALGQTVPDLSQPHPFGVHDMVRMERVGAPQVSPDGQSIVFTVRVWDPESNKATTNLWVMASDGTRLRQLTSAKTRTDSSPIWAPDGKSILFVSNRSGSRQFWTIALDGGEASPLSAFPVDVDTPRWSPKGNQLAFSAEVYPGSSMAETAKRDQARAESPVKAMKFDRLMIRHWDSWKDGKRSHIFVAPIEFSAGGGWRITAEPRDIMLNIDADCPIKPFGGSEDFAWAPDGQEITYTAQLGPDMAWSTDLNLYSVNLAQGETRCITAENRATDTGPAYSPDGRWIAYRAMARPGFEADRLVVHLYDRQRGTSRPVTAAWDRSAESIEWLADGKSMLVTANEQARQKVFRVTLENGSVQPVLNEHYNFGVALAGGGKRLVFGRDSLTQPVEIWSAALDGSDPRQLTHFTDARMQLCRMSAPDEFHFAGHKGEKVQAWLLKPVGFVDGKKYPVAFIIHGGPQGAIEDHFHYRWNPQAFAGAGYAVIAINFHGSTGFGQAFTDSISGDWGGKPFEDLMLGLDDALARYPWLDGERVGALGASYGGWMINWINGHTNRFKCLVNHDGGFDEFSNYFTTEELWFPEWEFKGVPWEKPELYEKFSPSRHIVQWQTPTLVIHGALDYRLVDVEGIATFTALQRKGIPSQLLYFPDENHWVLKPRNSIVWHETILEWLERWLKK
jgi:dipeptidyl aminopeptidase/acylaminoacyl peptidase